jgi:hypothetical protein
MKGETLAPRTRWYGVPTQPMPKGPAPALAVDIYNAPSSRGLSPV